MKKLFYYLAILFSLSLISCVPAHAQSEQQQDQYAGTASGTNTYSVSIPAITSSQFYDNQKIWVKFTNTNTGAATLQVNTYAAKSISLNNSGLAAGDIPANTPIGFVYNTLTGKWAMSKPGNSTGVPPPGGWGIDGNTLTTDTKFLGSLNNHDVLFKTNNLERMRILKNGNIGIGISNPIFQLQDSGYFNAYNSNYQFLVSDTAHYWFSALYGTGAVFRADHFFHGWANGNGAFSVSDSITGNYWTDGAGNAFDAGNNGHFWIDQLGDYFQADGNANLWNDHSGHSFEADANAHLWTDGTAQFESDASANNWTDGINSFNADGNGLFYQSGSAAFEGDAFAHLWVDGILASWEGDANGHNWSDGTAFWEGDAMGNNWSDGLGAMSHSDASGLYWTTGASVSGEFTVDDFSHIWTNNSGAIFEGDVNAFKWSDGADSITIQNGHLFYRSANFDTLHVSQNSFQFIGGGGGGFIDNATGMGIGTTNPIAPLDVHGSGTGNVLMGQFGGSSAYGALSLNGSLATDQQNFASSAGDKNLYINRPSTYNIYFQEGGAISSGFKTGGNFFIGQDLSVPVRLFASDAFVGVLAIGALHNDAVATNNNTSQLLFSNNRTTTGRTNVAAVGGIITDITDGAYKGALAFYTTDNTTIPTERMRITSTGALAINGASNYGTSGQVLTSNGNSYPTWQAAGKDPIAYFTPVTTNTITLTNNAYNIIDPAGTIALLTINLPSSPSDGDFVEIKFTQIITAITFTNGTLGGAETLTAAAISDYRKYVYRTASSKWY